MSTAKFSDDFKRDAVHQIVERGYPVAEVSKRLGVSSHSLYAWKKRFAKSHSRDGSLDAQAGEVRRLKLELARVTQERDILKEAMAYFERQQKMKTKGVWKIWGYSMRLERPKRTCLSWSMVPVQAFWALAAMTSCSAERVTTSATVVQSLMS